MSLFHFFHFQELSSSKTQSIRLFTEKLAFDSYYLRLEDQMILDSLKFTPMTSKAKCTKTNFLYIHSIFLKLAM